MTDQDPELLDDDELLYEVEETSPVWGLLDVVRGRVPVVPTTVYKTAGDSASGVAGLLLPSGDFLPVAPSRQGEVVTLHQDGETFTVETVWDGATRSPEFTVTLEDGRTEVRRESSKGILLADYASGMEIRRAKRDDVRTSQRGVLKVFPQGELRLPAPPTWRDEAA